MPLVSRTFLALLAINIAFAIAQTIVATKSVSATTFENDYPDLDAIDCSKRYGKYSWCKDNSARSTRGYDYRNCTDGTAYWVKKYTGISITGLGNAKDWDDNARNRGMHLKPGNASDIEPGDIAQSSDGEWGHVGFVTKIDRDMNGKIKAIEVADLNGKGTGDYAISYLVDKNSQGNFLRGGSLDWEFFIDANGLSKGLNNESPGSSGSSSPYSPIALLDFASAIWAKVSVNDPGFMRETGDGSARSIGAGGSRQTLLDFCNGVWTKEGVGFGGWNQEGGCGSAQDVAVSSNGTRALLNFCGAIWSKSAGLGYGGWNQETGCDGHKAIAAGGETRLLLNACNAVYAKHGGVGWAGWVKETECGAAQKVAVGADGTQLLLDHCGRVWAKKGVGYGGWSSETGCDGIQDIAVGNSRQAILNACGGVWAKNGIGFGGWQWETNCDSAKSIANGSNDMPILISLDSAIWARTPFGWVAQTGPGSAKEIDAG